MTDDPGAKLFEMFIDLLSDEEWHTVEEISEDLSLSVSSLVEFLKDLEYAGVIMVEGESYGKKNLVRGTDFVGKYKELPQEEMTWEL